MADHPYRGLPDPQFWNRAVTWAPPGGLDPVVATHGAKAQLCGVSAKPKLRVS